MRHESARVKKVVPDLGELLVYLTVASKITWRQIGPIFMQEILDRSVKWMVDPVETGGKGHRELLFLESDEVSDYRLQVSFDSSLTGRRLLMFQIFFFEKIGRPVGKSLNDVLKRLNSSYGRPPMGMETVLQKECTKIYEVKGWPEFYARIGLPCPPKPELTQMLRQAVTNSERKGYHHNKLSTGILLEERMQMDKSLGKEPSNPVPPRPVVGKPVQVFVGNLSPNVNAKMLENAFRQFGKVSGDVYYTNGGSLGYGHIWVENDEVVKTVMEFMQGFEIDNKPIKVELTKNKPSHPARKEDVKMVRNERYFPVFATKPPTTRAPAPLTPSPIPPSTLPSATASSSTSPTTTTISSTTSTTPSTTSTTTSTTSSSSSTSSTPSSSSSSSSSPSSSSSSTSSSSSSTPSSTSSTSSSTSSSSSSTSYWKRPANPRNPSYNYAAIPLQYNPTPLHPYTPRDNLLSARAVALKREEDQRNRSSAFPPPLPPPPLLPLSSPPPPHTNGWSTKVKGKEKGKEKEKEKKKEKPVGKNPYDVLKIEK
eukprot:Phypoly_transcript_05479.p1 GENE.Phypoly_transcript_05479~~Phypoly_transcript_05479.p1  ORF type:complete len:617 (+),score=181.68 Phypoly_transcript_05479:237-1853(+)